MTKKIQKLATLPEGRPETGAMSFGDDWPGIFIRGDNALVYAAYLRVAIEHLEMDAEPKVVTYTIPLLRGLAELLESCKVK